MLLHQLLIQHPEALGAILRDTPAGVWLLLVFLLGLGFVSARPRAVAPAQAVILPLAMGALALWGTVSAFAASGRLAGLLLLWLLCAAAVLRIGWHWRAPRGTRFDPSRQRLLLPGSWMPMILILAVFLMKYGIGVQLAMAPQLAQHGGFAIVVTALYAALSGLFAARTRAVLRLAHGPAAV